MSQPLLNLVSPEQAPELFKPIQDAIGMIPSVFQLYGNSPVLLKNRFEEIGYFMTHQRISGTFFALLRLVVAKREQCQYCIDMNRYLLTEAGWSLDEIHTSEQHPEQAPLVPAEKRLLLDVLSAVENSDYFTQARLQDLQALGWSQQDVLDAVHHAALAKALDTIIDIFKLETNHA